MDFTKSENNHAAILAGDSIAQFITGGGLACTCVKQDIAPQSAVYGFECSDIYEYKPTLAKRLVRLVGTRSHVQARFIEDCPYGDFGVEIERNPRGSVYLGDIVHASLGLSVSIGVGMTGEPEMLDIGKAPHVLIAGTTGSGKSVLLNTIIAGLVYKNEPQACELVLIDPKRVEFDAWAGIPHLRCPIVQGAENAVQALESLADEMDSRYEKMSSMGVKTAAEAGMNRIVCVIDELADLMLVSKKSVENNIVRIAQLGRAAGIHLVVATQSPRAAVVTGLIRANMPCKIALTCNGVRESMIVLDHGGAEKLLGAGDALIRRPGSVGETRFQAAYTPARDIEKLVSSVKANCQPVKHTVPLERRKGSVLRWILTGE